MIDVEKLIKQNSELMALLKIIHSFQLNDCWLCAGTLRNYIWDYLSTGSTSSNINFSDIDVIFFDKNISYEQTVEIENQIKKIYIVLILKSMSALPMLFQNFPKNVLP